VSLNIVSVGPRGAAPEPVGSPPPAGDPGQPVFYYDLGSPECYLVAEESMGALPVVPEWEPVVGAQLLGEVPPPDREMLERRAAELGMQVMRWPPTMPPDSLAAVRAATYAKQIGRIVAFSLAAFRQAFAGGRDLGDENTVLIAAAACEMHPTALLKAMRLRSVAQGVDAAHHRAAAAGVQALPAIEVGGQVFSGLDAVARAADALRTAV
jgi:2-hydroxychromene-2-carboxylate isomerase